jgi:hypothetical protein
MFGDASFLPFGPIADEGPSLRSNDLSPRLRRAGRDAYRRGWRQYRRAGCPFGPEDEAMLVWFSFSCAPCDASPTVGRN